MKKIVDIVCNLRPQKHSKYSFRVLRAYCIELIVHSEKKFKYRMCCAAKAFYSCPAIISRRPELQNTSKEPQLNTEEESKIIQARSHITLEKSSRNYKPSEE